MHATGTADAQRRWVPPTRTDHVLDGGQITNPAKLDFGLDQTRFQYQYSLSLSCLGASSSDSEAADMADGFPVVGLALFQAPGDEKQGILGTEAFLTREEAVIPWPGRC